MKWRRMKAEPDTDFADFIKIIKQANAYTGFLIYFDEDGTTIFNYCRKPEHKHFVKEFGEYLEKFPGIFNRVIYSDESEFDEASKKGKDPQKEE